jgi:hypothetical protein
MLQKGLAQNCCAHPGCQKMLHTITLCHTHYRAEYRAAKKSSSVLGVRVALTGPLRATIYIYTATALTIGTVGAVDATQHVSRAERRRRLLHIRPLPRARPWSAAARAAQHGAVAALAAATGAAAPAVPPQPTPAARALRMPAVHRCFPPGVCERRRQLQRAARGCCPRYAALSHWFRMAAFGTRIA